MSCEAERVTAFVDGALDEEAHAALEAHIAGCPDCRAQLDAEREIRGRLRALEPIAPDPRFEGELKARLRRARPRRLRWLLPFVASLVLGYIWLRGAAPFVAWELSRDHEHCFSQQTLPAKVLSGDPDVVTAWFEDQGTRLPLLPAAVGELELVGGRYCPLPGGSSAAHIYYASRRRQLSLFVVTRNVRFRAAYSSQARGNAINLLRVSGTTVGIVSEHARDVDAFRQAFFTSVAHSGRH